MLAGTLSLQPQDQMAFYSEGEFVSDLIHLDRDMFLLQVNAPEAIADRRLKAKIIRALETRLQRATKNKKSEAGLRHYRPQRRARRIDCHTPA